MSSKWVHTRIVGPIGLTGPVDVVGHLEFCLLPGLCKSTTAISSEPPVALIKYNIFSKVTFNITAACSPMNYSK